MTNCIDSEDWDGIDNIDEGFWRTDEGVKYGDAVGNPVLGKFRDGPHRVDAFAFAFDESVSDTSRTTVTLKNFFPVVEELWVRDWEGVPANEILDTDYFMGYYGAHWIAGSGQPLEPSFKVYFSDTCPSQDTVEVVIFFTEPMLMSSVIVTAGRVSPFNSHNVSRVRLSSRNCPNGYYDTWFGTLLIGASNPGTYTMSITGMDLDSNWIMDPDLCEWEVPATPYHDQYHEFYADSVPTDPRMELESELYNAAAGCPVRELYPETASSTSAMISTSPAASIAPPGCTIVPESTGNPSCLTDGLLSEPYVSSAGATGVEIDLGANRRIVEIVVEGMDGVAASGSMSAITGLMEETEETPQRFVRLWGIDGATEVLVLCGTSESVRMTVNPRTSASGGWTIPVPEVSQHSSGFEVRIYDLAGHVVWSDDINASTDAVLWEGRDASGDPVPPGLYLVLMDFGEEVLTGKLLVRSL